MGETTEGLDGSALRNPGRVGWGGRGGSGGGGGLI